VASIKIVLRKEIKKDGTSPLAIRITKDRKTSYIYLEYSIPQNDWDAKAERVKKSHSNSTRLNNYLLAKKAEANNESLELETIQKHVSAQTVRKRIKPTAQGSVFAQADLYIERLKQDRKYNRYKADKPRVERLKEFLKYDITFPDLTIALIRRFKAWLKAEHQVSERTAMNYLVVVRSIFSQAIGEKVCDYKYYPFGKGKVQIKFPESLKKGATAEDVVAIEELDLSGKPLLNHARNVWLFSFYFAGMRVSDLFRLKWSDFHAKRLYYSMGKNNKGDSIKIPEKAEHILAQYASQRDKTDLVFPELKGLDSLDDLFLVQMRIKTKLKVINKALKEVARTASVSTPITMHISRHTFGSLSGDRIPIQMLQKLYRHSSVSTTIGYQASFIHKDADEALEAVIGK